MGRMLIEQDQAAIRFEHHVKAPDDPHQTQRHLQKRHGGGLDCGWRMADGGLFDKARLCRAVTQWRILDCGLRRGKGG